MLHNSQVEVKTWRNQILLHQANRELKCRHVDGRNQTKDLSPLDLESNFFEVFEVALVNSDGRNQTKDLSSLDLESCFFEVFEVALVNSDRDCNWAKVGLGLS